MVNAKDINTAAGDAYIANHRNTISDVINDLRMSTVYVYPPEGVSFSELVNVYCDSRWKRCGCYPRRQHVGMNLTRILKRFATKLGPACSSAPWVYGKLTSAQIFELTNGAYDGIFSNDDIQWLASGNNRRKIDNIDQLARNADLALPSAAASVITLATELATAGNDIPVLDGEEKGDLHFELKCINRSTATAYKEYIDLLHKETELTNRVSKIEMYLDKINDVMNDARNELSDDDITTLFDMMKNNIDKTF